MAYLVYDLETTTTTYLKRKASPWCPDNWIVAIGWKKQGDARNSWVYNKDPKAVMNLHIPDDVTLLVGFNLKFDLLWQWGNPELKAFFKRGGRIWDCQYVEYLLHGADQRYHMVSLDETAPKYGGRKKIDEVKILWEAEVNTNDIPEDLLIDYLVGTPEEDRNSGDIGNTEQVFLGQVQKAKELNMLPAIWSRMDGLCATTEMEWNGLQIDIEEARAQLKELREERAAVYAELHEYIPPLPPELTFNWGSRAHKSALIFGGSIKYQVREPYIDPKTKDWARFKRKEQWPVFTFEVQGPPYSVTRDAVSPTECTIKDGLHYYNGRKQDVYVSGQLKGQPKTKLVTVDGELKIKWQDRVFKFPGYIEPRPEFETATLDAAGAPLYSTGSDVMAALAGVEDVPFIKTLTRADALDKELGTYFLEVDDKGNMSGMLTCVDPRDKRIHHKLNHTSTVTTRLSSNDPNLQNIPRADKSKIKKLFISRFEGGVMGELDYAQLEVVVQGVLSGDKQLCEDLRNKIDFHCKRISIQPKYGKTYDEVLELCNNEDGPDYKYWKSVRTKNKVFSFQRAYGAGAALIALSTGMTVDEVNEIIVAEEATYPGVPAFNKMVEAEVNNSAVPFRDPMMNMKVYRRGYYTTVTGCRYCFRSYDPPEWMQHKGVTDTFSPTQLKNYPIQGTGGEIVQGISGRLWRKFVETDNFGGLALLCNTVHDCIWVDMHPSVVHIVIPLMKEQMEAVGDWFQLFGVTIDVPFPVAAETGPNMLELHHAA